MKNNVAVMLMSHGNFAKSAIESAELIIGKQENYDTLSIFTTDQIEHLKQEMTDKINNLNTLNGLVILTDIIGGTPINLAGNLMTKENIIICSGLNLPMLLEIFMNREKNIDELKTIIEEAYKDGMIIRTSNSLIKECDEDDLL